MTATSLGWLPRHTHHASPVHEPPAAILAIGIIVALTAVCSFSSLMSYSHPDCHTRVIYDIGLRLDAGSLGVSTVGVPARGVKFMPKSASEFLSRALGMEHVFLEDIDVEVRRAYEDRACGVES
jgi:hypothetical protein